jgi:hypothetical protein
MGCVFLYIDTKGLVSHQEEGGTTKEQAGVYRVLLVKAVRCASFWLLYLPTVYRPQAWFYTPKGARSRSRIASVQTASFGPAGVFCGNQMGHDKTNTGFGDQRIFPAAANGVQRRQTRAGVPKKQFPASKKKNGGRAGISGIFSDLTLFTGCPAFVGFIQV